MRWCSATALCALVGCLDSPPSASTPGSSCGSVRVLRDDFEGEGLAVGRWYSIGGVEAVGGVARFAASAGVGAAMQSIPHYQVGGGALTVELDPAGLADGVFDAIWEAPDDSGVGVRLAGDELSLVIADSEGIRAIDAMDFGEGPGWWRLREEAGAFWWGTSADGDHFDERGPFESNVTGTVRVLFGLNAGESDAEVSVLSINQLEAEPLCPASTLVEEFDTLTPRWEVSEEGDCRIDVVGQARLAYSAQAFCALTTRELFDLGDSAFAVEPAMVGDCAPQPVSRVQLSSGENLEIFCRNVGGERKLVVASSVAGDLANVDYDPTGHRFVRFRHDSAADGVVFETSSGDASWPRLALRLLGRDEVADVSLRFYLGGDTTTGGFETVAFESVNASP